MDFVVGAEILSWRCLSIAEGDGLMGLDMGGITVLSFICFS